MTVKIIGKPRVFCEILCGYCGGLHCNSGYNLNTRKFIAETSKEGWRFTKDYGNTCPDCMEKLLKRGDLHEAN